MALKVFPGAMGFGTDTRAAYGAKGDPVICIVSSLEADAPLEISVRNEKEVITGGLNTLVRYDQGADRGKIIMFEVSGTIVHEDSMPLITPYTSIWGQTAPSPGITLKGTTFLIKAHDVLLQHIRIRTGDKGGLNPDIRDALGIQNHDTGEDVYNVVVDHCSISWGIDENIQIWEDWGGRIYNCTISNTISSEALLSSKHSKGFHGMGLLIGQNISSISLIRNLIAHSRDRVPSIKWNTSTHVINNIIYNLYTTGIKYSGTTDSPLDTSIIGNVMIKGRNSVTDYGISIKSTVISGSRFYVKDNQCENYDQVDDWTCVQQSSGIDYRVMEPPVPISDIEILESKNVVETVLSSVGARPGDKDSVDLGVISDVTYILGNYINCVELDTENTKCDTPTEVAGGWPPLEKNVITLELPDNPNMDDDNDGYTNLEEWAHKLGDNLSNVIKAPIDLMITNQ